MWDTQGSSGLGTQGSVAASGEDSNNSRTRASAFKGQADPRAWDVRLLAFSVGGRS